MTHPTDKRRSGDDEYKRDPEKIDRAEGRGGKAPQRSAAQGFPTDPEKRRSNDRDHRREQPMKNCHQQGQMPARHIQPAETEQDQRGGQHEQPPRHHPAAPAMQPPAEIGRELLRLRPRQQHAEIQRMEEMALRNPLPPLYQLPVHDRDLPRRTTETDQPELEPIAERCAEGWHTRRMRGGRAGGKPQRRESKAAHWS